MEKSFAEQQKTAKTAKLFCLKTFMVYGISHIILSIMVPNCYTVEPVYYRHLGTNQRCPDLDYQGVLIFQVSLYDFGTIARCPDYAGVHIFKCPD